MSNSISVNQDKQTRRLQSNMSNDNDSGYINLPRKTNTNTGHLNCFWHKLKSGISKAIFWSGEGVPRLFQSAKCVNRFFHFRAIFGIVDNFGIE
jgi:hypothetical protein